MEGILLEFAIVVSLAAGLAIVFRVLKQPAILAYILAGIIVGPLGLYHIHEQEFIRAMAEFGITLLLFMMGLELKLSEFKYVGKATLIASVGQIAVTSIASYFISIFLGYNQTVSLYLAAALTFSSTIVILKFISDKRDSNSLYGRISIGILLVQDFVAILILMFLSGFSPGEGAGSINKFAIVMLKGVWIFAILYFLSKSILPKILDYLAKSQEILFLSSIAWVLSLSAFIASRFVGFTVEIGGFLAGLALANSRANYQIIARVKILRDFFIVLFFVVLGMQMGFSDISKILFPGIVLSLFVLLVKPLIIIFLVDILGYKKRTAFLTGVGFGQVSEFSLILVFIGERLGHIPQEVVSLVAFVSVVTFATSTYSIIKGKNLYNLFGKYISFGNKKHDRKEPSATAGDLTDIKNHVVVVGFEEMGETIVEALEDDGRQIVVVDFNPDAARKISGNKIHSVFGDISDIEIQDRISLDKASLVISTVPDPEDNTLLIKRLKRQNSGVVVIVIAFDLADAKELYKEGADYVVLPHLAGGRQLAQILKKEITDETFKKLKEKDLDFLGINI